MKKRVVRFSDAVDMVKIPVVGNGRKFRSRKHERTEVFPEAFSDQSGVDSCWAIARARELEAQVNGRIYDVEWPTYWCVNSDRVNIFIGRGDSFSNVDLLWADDNGKNVPPVKAAWVDPMLVEDREVALHMLRSEMWNRSHFGRVPDASELADPVSTPPPLVVELLPVAPRAAEGVVSTDGVGRRKRVRSRKKSTVVSSCEQSLPMDH